MILDKFKKHKKKIADEDIDYILKSWVKENAGKYGSDEEMLEYIRQTKDEWSKKKSLGKTKN